mmetsp:Transcript_50572/g.118101  ORF Transcript_50572/g.118101 Transcript_50572/m.118101 type:complete len:260 (+) Transcript_50572:60-839(+)
MGMPAMGMMGPMAMHFGMPRMGFEEDRHQRRRDRSKSGGRRGDDKEGVKGESPPGRRTARRRHKDRIEEVEQFIDENKINEEAALKIRELSPGGQRRVIARPLTGDVQNPSKVMITRVREQREKRTMVNDPWKAWGSAFAEAVKAFIQDNDLDQSAARQLEAMPPHHQAVALRWDLSGVKNPSARFTSLANGLAASPGGLPPPMFGMPPMPGMPPMLPPMLPGMGMMHPGMGPLMGEMGMPGAAKSRSRDSSESPSLDL